MCIHAVCPRLPVQRMGEGQPDGRLIAGYALAPRWLARLFGRRIVALMLFRVGASAGPALVEDAVPMEGLPVQPFSCEGRSPVSPGMRVPLWTPAFAGERMPGLIGQSSVAPERLCRLRNGTGGCDVG